MDFMVIVGIIFIFLGLVFLVVSILQMRKAKAAEAWPITPGIVLASGLAERRSHNSKTHRTTVTYEPQVEYEYSLMGQKYTGKRIAFGYASYDYGTASGKIAPYPQGAGVQVHYDPADPLKAVLETKAAGGVGLIILAAILIIMGIVLMVV